MVKFSNYKSLGKWLRERTDNPFYITCTKSNKVDVVIARNNELIIKSDEIGYWQWFTEASAQKFLDFINQK